MKQRVWELDALRGVCILGMAAVHLGYDLAGLYGVPDRALPGLFTFVMEWGGVIFVVLSGICATLGKNCVKRGLAVFSCGMLVSAVTLGMAFLGYGQSVIIYFGVLHCLGACMVLWRFLKRLPTPQMTAAGIVMVAAGLWLRERTFSFPWLLSLGFMPHAFATADYFPLLPYLGFFLLGGVLGRRLYPDRESLLPKIDPDRPVIRFFRACGRHSLAIYLLHQPVIFAGIWLLSRVL